MFGLQSYTNLLKQNNFFVSFMQIKGYLVIFAVYIYDYFLLYAKISAVMLSLYALFSITLLL